jgi:excisionase family DNA binding protein
MDQAGVSPGDDGDDDAVDLATAASLLGVHYQTAYAWVRDGKLPATRGRGRWWVSTADVEAAREAPAAAPPTRLPAATQWQRQAEKLERLLLAGEELGARDLVLGVARRGAPVLDVLQRLVVPVMRATGERWERGEIGVAEEHRATAIVERLLGDLSPNPRGRRRGTAVVAAPAGERHTLPTTLAAAALRADNWRVEHLGSDLPADEIRRFASLAGADLVVLSITGSDSTSRRLASQLERAGTPTLVGAPGRTLTELVDEARQVIQPR